MKQFPPSELPVNTLPATLGDGIIAFLQSNVDSNIRLESFKIISGGCINHAGLLKTSVSEFFIKWNDAEHLPDMFEAESKGLSLLASTKTVRIPRVVGTGKTDRHQFIILEFLDRQQPGKSFWKELGHQLAELHQFKGQQFGLEYDNYIGSIKQYNTQTSDWIRFFTEERISRQLMMAEKSGLTDHSLRKKFDIIFQKINSLLPTTGRPSLIHGDLWGGNIVSDAIGNPCLIDPAVYYGIPEMEIAYTRLFGEFNKDFYSAYQEVNPIPPGFEHRMDIYNLYPLLVHANLFGRSYLTRIDQILERFI
jgi:protein-ribulosamine 3-kinase